MPEATTATAPLKCLCGFERTHGLIRPEPHYGLIGTVLLIFAGAGARPKRIDYRCPRCNTIIETVTDPVALRNFH